jgi:hypothetical protein
VSYDNNDKKQESVYSKRIKAGKRRTYFLDVRSTKANDYFVTITESRKRANDDGYDRHKIFLYKEDFSKFCEGLQEVIQHVKTELMPNFDFDAFNHYYPDADTQEVVVEIAEPHSTSLQNHSNNQPANQSSDEVDKW